jgi:hypothetical protein
MIPRFVALVTTASLLALTSCSGGMKYSYSNVSVVIAPQVTSVQAGSTQSFSTTVANAPNLPIWTINGNIAIPNSATATLVGSFSTPTTDAPTGTYTAPPTPPIYTAAQAAAGQAQGTVTLGAFVHSSESNILSTVATSTSFAIVGPISTGLSPATATVRLGTSLQLTAYVVGTLNNGYTLKVNGFSGGGVDVGMISAAGLYTAPAVMPMSGGTITITAVANADTTKTATATITLQ